MVNHRVARHLPEAVFFLEFFDIRCEIVDIMLVLDDVEVDGRQGRIGAEDNIVLPQQGSATSSAIRSELTGIFIQL